MAPFCPYIVTLSIRRPFSIPESCYQQRGAAGFGVYSSTKFAVGGLSEALHDELAPLGIHVTVIEPGYFRTDFLDSSSLSVSGDIIGDYAETVGKVRTVATRGCGGKIPQSCRVGRGGLAIFSEACPVAVVVERKREALSELWTGHVPALTSHAGADGNLSPRFG